MHTTSCPFNPMYTWPCHNETLNFCNFYALKSVAAEYKLMQRDNFLFTMLCLKQNYC